MPIGMNGLNLAFLGAQLAGIATFLAPLEPVEQAHPAGDGQGGAQRAEVTAEHLAGEDIDHQQDHRVEHEPPLAVELEHDGGLERLYLGGLLGQHHRFQEDAEQYQQDDVLDGPQPLVHREGQLVLGISQLARVIVDTLLQRTEGAQPAAEHAPTPEQDAGGGEGPEDEDHRIAEEQFPAELGYQGMHEGQHVDHRQLPQRIPADEHHGEGQVAVAQPAQEGRMPGEGVLEEQDDGQQQQGNQDHADLKALLVPDVDPHRPVGLLDGAQLLGGGFGALDVVLGCLVRQLEGDKCAVYRPGLAAYQQLQGPGGARIEQSILTQDEHPQLLEARRAVGHEVIQALVIQVAEAVDVAELSDLEAIVDATADKARALVGVPAIAQHGKGVFAGLEILHQETVLVVAQQVAADGRRIQVGHVQVDEGLFKLVRRHLIDLFGSGADKGLIDLGIAQQQAADGSIPDQFGPAGWPIDLLEHSGRATAGQGIALDQPRAAPTSWAARITISLTTMTVTVAPATASTVTASGSFERPTTTRWSARMPWYRALISCRRCSGVPISRIGSWCSST